MSLFKKWNSHKKIKWQKTLKNWPIEQWTWVALSLNSQTFGQNEETLYIEGHDATEKVLYKWGTNSQKAQLECLKDDKREVSLNLSHEESLPLTREILHFHLLRVRELLIDWAKQREETEPLSELQTQAETKAQEWLSVSFKVLRNAVEKGLSSTNNPHRDYTLQSMIFCGDQDGFKFKLRIYNLDIELREISPSKLKLSVYDKKDQQEFKPHHLCLSADLDRQTNAIIDEIIQILPFVEEVALKTFLS